MRINPVLNWAYSDVWAYLRAIEAKFCHLYLEGYTSLGTTRDTAPNSALRRADGSYAPAYTLNGMPSRILGQAVRRDFSGGACALVIVGVRGLCVRLRPGRVLARAGACVRWSVLRVGG